MTRKNLTFGYPVYTDDVTLSGGSWESDYPLARMQELPLAKVARTTGVTLANTQFRIDFSRTRPVSAVGLARHNMTIDAQVRVRLYDSADTLLADSGWEDVWPKIYAPFTLSWGDPSFMTLRPEVDQIDGEIATHVAIFDAAELTDYATVEIDDEANAAGYIEIGYCAPADLKELQFDIVAGASEGFIERSRVDVSQGGVRSVERRAKPRSLVGEFISDTNFRRGLISRMQQERDLDKPFLVIQEPQNELFQTYTQFLAVWSELSAGERAFAGWDRQPIKVEQVL